MNIIVTCKEGAGFGAVSPLIEAVVGILAVCYKQSELIRERGRSNPHRVGLSEVAVRAAAVCGENAHRE